MSVAALVVILLALIARQALAQPEIVAGTATLADWPAYDATVRGVGDGVVTQGFTEYRGPYRSKFTAQSFGGVSNDPHGSDVGATGEYDHPKTRQCYPRFQLCLEGTIEDGLRQGMAEWQDPGTPAQLARKGFVLSTAQPAAGAAGGASHVRREVIPALRNNCPPVPQCKPGDFDQPARSIEETIRYRSDGLPVGYTRRVNGVVVEEYAVIDLKIVAMDAPFASPRAPYPTGPLIPQPPPQR